MSVIATDCVKENARAVMDIVDGCVGALLDSATPASETVPEVDE